MDKRRGRMLLAAAGAGLVNGLFGGGGGAILLPLLRRAGGLGQRQAMALCVSVMAPVSAVSAALYMGRGAVALSAAWPYLLGGFFGGLLAGGTLKRVNPVLLRRLFGLVLLWAGVRSWL